jgi:ligand-binding sensor domain-containing protein
MKIMMLLALTLTALLSSCRESGSTQKSVELTVENSITAGDTVGELSNNIMVIHQDKKNNYWLGSWKDGLFKYNGKSIVHYTTQHGLPDKRVEEIKEDKHGNVFINTRGGLWKYDGRQFILIPETKPLMSGWNLQPDDLWFKSTKMGHICRYDGKSLMSLEIPKSRAGEEYLAKNPNIHDPYGVYFIYKDSKGNIWFGTAIMGAFRYNGKSFDWISESDVTEMHNGPANGVRGIAEDEDGYLWFNTEYKYNVYNRPSSENNNTASATFYERIRSLGCLDGKKDGDLNEFSSILKDDNNNLWIAIYLNGVWKYDGVKTIHYPIRVDDKNVPIYGLFKDNAGSIWLGSNENGAFRFTGQGFEKFKP